VRGTERTRIAKSGTHTVAGRPARLVQETKRRASDQRSGAGGYSVETVA